MNLLNRLSKRFQTLLFVLLAIVPLWSTSPSTFAADDESGDFSQAELDQMLAPIALYPDALLSQVLIASTYPLEVVQADRWVRTNKDLKTDDALKFAENKDWDPSVKALVAFPDVLQRMSENIDWTQRLGDAFLGDEDEVMDAVQRLRKRAYASGNLEKAQHISVEQDNDNIVIEPAQERVVYVPVYDTRVVYGNWWWPEYPPVYWHYPSSYTYVSGFYWGSSIYVGPTYFYSSCHWRDRRVVVIDRHTHYSGNPRFYTGRSIVRHEGARAWRHDPVHRHGVGYYNNNLRETYGSRHDTRRSDREYREQYRDRIRQDQRGGNANNDPRVEHRFNNGTNRTEVKNDVQDRASNVDRADRIRDRLNQRQSVGESNIGNANEGAMQNRGHRRDQRDGANIQAQAPTANGEGNPRPRDIERVRPSIQQRIETNRGDANDGGGRVIQERRLTNEQARPNFTPPAPRVAPEERANPSPRTERREESPRRAEFSPSQRMENRNEQRAERMNSRERQGDQDRAR
ncbi:MAG: DUF3300 domain-containing protein [Gammaproteobacteria bacterium]|nr:MAG: DUF3300 domain-containing protein [Gammaproteobacteria bacterium]